MSDVSIALRTPCWCPSGAHQHSVSAQSSINLAETAYRIRNEKPHRPKSRRCFLSISYLLSTDGVLSEIVNEMAKPHRHYSNIDVTVLLCTRWSRL